MKKALLFIIGVLLTMWFSSAAGTRFKEGEFWYEPINDTEVELVRYERYEYAGRRASNILPSSVQHDGRAYTVVSIGKKAVHELLHGDTIIIPNTVRELKDSAFYLLIASKEYIAASQYIFAVSHKEALCIKTNDCTFAA